MNLKATLIVALTVSASFLADAGEVVVQTWNNSTSVKEYAEWSNSIRGAGWRYGSMGASGSNRDGRESTFTFRGSNKDFGCLYRDYRNETQCGTFIWNENNALFKVTGQCKIERPHSASIVLSCD